MLRRFAWLVMGCATIGSALLSNARVQAQEVEPAPAAKPKIETPAETEKGHIAAAEQEMHELMDKVLADTDVDKNGELSQAESQIAREHVAVAMRQTLPRSGFIAGGQVIVDRMEHVILQSAMDFNQDHVVDKVELQKFIIMSMGIRERTRKTPISAQYQISEEEIAKHDFERQNRAAMEQQKLKNYRWIAVAKRQRDQVWFETEMIKRIMRAEQLRDYEKMREREKNNPTTPGTAAKAAPADEPAPVLEPKRVPKPEPKAELPEPQSP